MRWVWAALLTASLLSGGCDRGAQPSTPSVPSPLVIDVVGRDFLWQFRYPGPDQTLGTADDLVASKDLHLPLDHDIHLRLTSEDYIYTFRAADLKLKEAAVPELQFHLEFRTAQAGRYPLEVDPMCAVKFLHYEEMGWLVIEDADTFRRWLSEAPRQTDREQAVR